MVLIQPYSFTLAQFYKEKQKNSKTRNNLTLFNVLLIIRVSRSSHYSLALRAIGAIRCCPLALISNVQSAKGQQPSHDSRVGRT